MAVNSVRLARAGDFEPEGKEERTEGEDKEKKEGEDEEDKEDEEKSDLLMTYGSPDAGLDVFGKPMRLLNPMESTLTFQISQGSVEGSQAGWRVEEHIKSVPRGLWSKCKSAFRCHYLARAD